MFEHSALWYADADDESISVYPGMCALVRDVEGEVVTVHRTFLQDARKAPVQNPRKVGKEARGRLAGTAIRLYAADDRLAIAEGVESALAVRLMTGWPVWSTRDANGMKSLELPRTVNQLDIWADHDPVGHSTAFDLKRRLRDERPHLQVRVHVPPVFDMDPLNWYLADPLQIYRCRRLLSDCERMRCPTCLEMFNSESAFDQHRFEKAGERRCRTPEQMREIGMKEGAGGWTTKQHGRRQKPS